ncbi:MAG: hypothetical protein U9Q37_00985 [Euryarchaeota archaeon]|nr:hypothetical protein [Euryarchaeota archaeon]
MSEKLLDRIKVFEEYYSLGVNRSLPKLREALVRRYKSGVPSEGTLKKWSGRFKWQNQIVIRDNAAAEGVAEKMTEAMVDTKMKELEHLDRAMSEIDAVMPLIFDALQSCTVTDPETGKKRVRIIPETTSDMTALYNAQSRFVTAKTKLIETMRKVRGESDNVQLKTVLDVRYEESTKE